MSVFVGFSLGYLYATYRKEIWGRMKEWLEVVRW
jgi:hypothetical protein